MGWKQKLKRFVTGWVNYYKLANMGEFLKNIDEWMRRRIRMVMESLRGLDESQEIYYDI